VIAAADATQLNGDALACNFLARGSNRAFALSVSPDRERDEQKIESDVCLAASRAANWRSTSILSKN